MEEKAPRISPRTEQHMQPLSMTMTCSAAESLVLIRSSSIGTAPNSFSMTAIFLSHCVCSRWLSSVVLPAPKKPVSTVIGICAKIGVFVGAASTDGGGTAHTSTTTPNSVNPGSKQAPTM